MLLTKLTPNTNQVKIHIYDYRQSTVPKELAQEKDGC